MKEHNDTLVGGGGGGGIRSCSLRAKLSRRIFPGSRIICHKGFRSTLDFCPQFL